MRGLLPPKKMDAFGMCVWWPGKVNSAGEDKNIIYGVALYSLESRPDTVFGSGHRHTLVEYLLAYRYFGGESGRL